MGWLSWLDPWASISLRPGQLRQGLWESCACAHHLVKPGEPHWTQEAFSGKTSVFRTLTSLKHATTVPDY